MDGTEGHRGVGAGLRAAGEAQGCSSDIGQRGQSGLRRAVGR